MMFASTSCASRASELSRCFAFCACGAWIETNATSTASTESPVLVLCFIPVAHATSTACDRIFASQVPLVRFRRIRSRCGPVRYCLARTQRFESRRARACFRLYRNSLLPLPFRTRAPVAANALRPPRSRYQPQSPEVDPAGMGLQNRAALIHQAVHAETVRSHAAFADRLQQVTAGTPPRARIYQAQYSLPDRQLLSPRSG